LVELILTVCLLAQPAVCKDQHIPFLREINVRSCMWQGQLQAVHWLADHPQWRIRRWRCGWPEA